MSPLEGGADWSEEVGVSPGLSQSWLGKGTILASTRES
jgi:hypothetical protein